MIHLELEAKYFFLMKWECRDITHQHQGGFTFVRLDFQQEKMYRNQFGP